MSAVKEAPNTNEAGYEYAIGYSRNLLRPFGIWPGSREHDDDDEAESRRRGPRPRAVANCLCLFVLFFVVGPYFVQTFLIEKDNQVRIKSTGACVFGMTNVAKYLVFLLRGRRIGSCLSEMRLDWRSISDAADRRLMLRNARAARLLGLLSFVFMFGGGVPYVTVLPLSQPAELLVLANDNRTLVRLRPLPYPSYFFGLFEPRARPVYDLVFGVHFCFGILAFSLTTGLCSFIAMCTLHVASRCAFVSAMYRELGRNFDRQLLERVVVQHRRIIAFARDLEDIFHETCMAEFLGNTINICLVGFYLIMDFERSEPIGIVTFLCLLIALVFNVFIFCYVGEILTEQCRLVGKYVYAVDWYELPAREARNFVLILAQTQRPIVLTAGKMFVLSMQNFANVMKASATYLHMLRTVTVNL